MVTNTSALGIEFGERNQPSPGSAREVSSALHDEVAQLKETVNTMRAQIDELQVSLEDKDRRLLTLRADLAEKNVIMDQLVRKDQEKTRRLAAIESRLIAIMSALGPDFMDKVEFAPPTPMSLTPSYPSQSDITSSPPSSQKSSQPASPMPPSSPSGGSILRDDAGSDDDSLA
jgi:hypothetical protein